MKPPVFREVSTYFFIEYHDTTHGIKFLYQNIRETIKNFKKNQWYQVTKKKMRGISLILKIILKLLTS